ncbi:5-(carboxyamino)imidazole ribonucleotide synthase [Lederbergia citrea]|uniref:N5-carboxyaminoimidazole ribonucleotide synthase n=1 Tax=Lederbergia citrea TaxID=2833581 RepID=A0A942UMY9_9BACI|nr:5-(carboxyamino)imidazole ribonucleotide synthase [Lederbergia citrea]MBS4179477.1 5-(carboxyamino)imidazole ribonucleotide synthase [Lederbergia citrea]MBS4224406.1 5-(carboxyamino)imidazole ribonucleotide synthase [Lederbergia citrea]
MSKTFIKPGQTIGIIGGGQLGRMMTFSAKEAGFRVIVLEPSQDSPAGQAADEQIVAAYDDHEALAILAEKSDVITYEFENIDYEALRKLTEKSYIPQGAELIKITQDRILEKQALTDAGVEVAPYSIIQTENDLELAVQKIGFPCVLKTSRGGYDGKGQYVINKQEDCDEAGSLLRNGPCVLEAWIPFEKEISVVMARSVEGELNCFPIGENIHENNILHETIVPARVSGDVEDRVLELAKKIADQLNLVGTLAVELFLTEDGNLFVNELAPRPHNSGHYTIEACNISQFGQHIRAISGWPLQEAKLLKPAVMVNILGQHVEAVMSEIPQRPDWSIHFYGKKEAKHNRKMGHVTILTEDIDTTLQELDASEVWNS